MTRGRPRSFDCDKALDQAMEVFWREGYEAASIADLTQAMGINPPSLYAAFGNKEALFRKALDRYVGRRSVVWQESMTAPTAWHAVESLLRRSADLLTNDCSPGCLMVKSSLTCGGEALQREMAAVRARGEALLKDRFEQAKREGDLPADVDPTGLARYVMALGQGMSIQAASGASNADLHKIVDVALLTFPGAPATRKPNRRGLKVAR
jgi:AcrR family transcriptional regulator